MFNYNDVYIRKIPCYTTKTTTEFKCFVNLNVKNNLFVFCNKLTILSYKTAKNC